VSTQFLQICFIVSTLFNKQPRVQSTICQGREGHGSIYFHSDLSVTQILQFPMYYQIWDSLCDGENFTTRDRCLNYTFPSFFWFQAVLQSQAIYSSHIEADILCMLFISFPCMSSIDILLCLKALLFSLLRNNSLATRGAWILATVHSQVMHNLVLLSRVYVHLRKCKLNPEICALTEVDWVWVKLLLNR